MINVTIDEKFMIEHIRITPDAARRENALHRHQGTSIDSMRYSRNPERVESYDRDSEAWENDVRRIVDDHVTFYTLDYNRQCR